MVRPMCVFASNVQVQLLPESKIFIWIKRNTDNLTGQAYTTLIVTHNFYFTLISFLFSNNNDNPMTLFMSYTVICVTYFCIAWTMPSQDVCPSVCLSVTHRYYVLTAKHILKFFFLRRQSIVVFPYQTLWQYSDEELPLQCVECKGHKNRDFQPISRFISEMLQDRGTVTMECE